MTSNEGFYFVIHNFDHEEVGRVGSNTKMAMVENSKFYA